MRVVIEGVRKSYPLPCGSGSITALDGIDLTLEKGETVFISGPSGSGKTSLLAIIAALARPTAGRVIYDGSERQPQPGQVSCSFQEPVFVPELTVLENLLLPASRHRLPSFFRRGEELLEAFGLDGMFDLFPWALSGGEKRRLDLARAILLPARLILLDEPAAWLDEMWSRKAMELIMDFAGQNGSSLLVATHDRLPETGHAGWIKMENGKVIDHGYY